MGCPSPWLLRIQLMIEFSTPKLRGVGTLIALLGSRGEKPIFGTVFGGGLDKRKFCRSGPCKTHFAMYQRLVDEN